VTVGIRNPYDAPGRFLKAQLHCHTTESDGRFRPRELLEMYREAGYAFVCITDHNRVTRCEHLNDHTFLAIPACEDTVSRILPPLGPHMGRFFVDEPLRSGSPQERIDRTRADGGIVSICHPSWSGNLWTGGWSVSELSALRGVQLVEIWNPHSNPVEDARRWDAALRAGGPEAPVWGVAVDDCHRREQFNRGWIMVRVPEVSAPALRRALVGGAFYASTGPGAEFSVDGQTITVRLQERGRIRFLTAHRAPLVEVDGEAASYAVRGDEQFVRVEAIAPSGTLWSQPFHLTAET